MRQRWSTRLSSSARTARATPASRSFSRCARARARRSVRTEVTVRSWVAAAIMPSIAVVQSTEMSAQPRWLFRLEAARVSVLLFEERLNFGKLVTQFIGDLARLPGVVDHVRGNKHHQLIAVHGIARVREQVPKIRNILQQWNARIGLGHLIAEKAAEGDVFAVGNRDGTRNFALLDRRRIDG